MVRVKEPPIVTTTEWGAVLPSGPLANCGTPSETLFHHTAGHHPEIKNPANESFAELVAYAKNIQRFHMHDNGWLDSGHNFLVGRNGMILVGRHQSYTRVKQGQMIVSAHCPGHNKSPGIEFEHEGLEGMTPIQRRMGAWLYAWIHDRCNIRGVVIYPHRKFFNTDCPGALLGELPVLRSMVRDIRSGKVGI